MELDSIDCLSIKLPECSSARMFFNSFMEQNYPNASFYSIYETLPMATRCSCSANYFIMIIHSHEDKNENKNENTEQNVY